MSPIPTTKAPDFTNGPLYLKLVEVLPHYVKHIRDAAGETATLHVASIYTRLEMSPEGFYKWLRSSTIKPVNAKKLVELANSPENVAALAKIGRQPPTLEDFLPFVFSA